MLDKLSEADWKKKTSGEEWTVGVVAHHVAGSHEGIAGIIKTVASGQSMPNFTMDMLYNGGASAQYLADNNTTTDPLLAACAPSRFGEALRRPEQPPAPARDQDEAPARRRNGARAAVGL